MAICSLNYSIINSDKILKYAKTLASELAKLTAQDYKLKGNLKFKYLILLQSKPDSNDDGCIMILVKCSFSFTFQLVWSRITIFYGNISLLTMLDNFQEKFGFRTIANLPNRPGTVGKNRTIPSPVSQARFHV
ncbi:MAG: hypothetical protein K9L30_18755 [Desulfobacterales bacterium]|nr:hypothetical protein [Desulfobacterales bacterium]